MSTGQVANIEDATNLSRGEDISFLRSYCVVGGTAIDSRVTKGNPLSYQFSFKLPQYINTDTATPVVRASIIPAPSTVAKSLTNLF